MSHVDHIVWNVDAGDDDCNQMEYFRLNELLAILFCILIFVEIRCDEPEFGGSREISNRQQNHMMSDAGEIEESEDIVWGLIFCHHSCLVCGV